MPYSLHILQDSCMQYSVHMLQDSCMQYSLHILQDSCMQYSVRVRTHITRQLYTLYNAGCSVQCHIVNGSFIEYSVQCTYGERQLY